MGEFDLIRQFFSRPVRQAVLGSGDDAALLSCRAGFEHAVSTDLLIEGRHFLAAVDPESLGWKALAVNLSDLAAMGAHPLAFTLGLALPQVDAPWLEAFAAGLYACADRFCCELVGGDTTRGPLTIAITVIGEVPAGEAIRRHGARIDDDIWLSGQVGSAALGLAFRQGRILLEGDAMASACAALERPVPRIGVGENLRGIATAMLDVSDGLLGDLRHLINASGVGATLHLENIPMDAGIAALPEAARWQYALAGGDDYELCFTAPIAMREFVRALAEREGVSLTRIGRCQSQHGMFLTGSDGRPWSENEIAALRGYDHFH